MLHLPEVVPPAFLLLIRGFKFIFDVHTFLAFSGAVLVFIRGFKSNLPFIVLQVKNEK